MRVRVAALVWTYRRRFEMVYWLIITPMIVELTRWVLMSGYIRKWVSCCQVHVPWVVFDVMPWDNVPAGNSAFGVSSDRAKSKGLTG